MNVYNDAHERFYLIKSIRPRYTTALAYIRDGSEGILRDAAITCNPYAISHYKREIHLHHSPQRLELIRPFVLPFFLRHFFDWPC
jgi:hypothetical protein